MSSNTQFNSFPLKVLTALFFALSSACSAGDDLPNLGMSAVDGDRDGRASSQGCSNEGAVRDCHVKLGERAGLLTCYAGEQECRGGVWGPCGGSGTLSTRSAPPAAHAENDEQAPSLAPQAVSGGPTNTSATCVENPCNPHCWAFDEDPVDDITPVMTPGATIYVNGEEWGNGPAGFVNKQNCGYLEPSTTPRCFDPYVRSCGGATHQNRFDGCLADHSCNLTTGRCDRNQPDWRWPEATCPGVDLTIGPACIQDLGAGPKQGFLLCNRGNSAVTAGATVTIRINNGDAGWFVTDTCSPNKSTATNCDVVVATGLDAGQCVRVVDSGPLAAGEVGPCGGSVWGTGNPVAFVNPQDSPYKIAECGVPLANPATSATMPGCSNNWSDVKKGANACTSIEGPPSYKPKTVIEKYVATCPGGTKPVWDKLAWSATVNCSPGACNGSNESSIKFEARTASASNPTSFAPASAITLATVQGDRPPNCPMSGGDGCPVDLYTALGSALASNAVLELSIIQTPSADGLATSSVGAWQLTYSCPPAE